MLPSTKVTAATVAAALGTIVVWLLHQVASVEVPDVVSGAIVVLLTLGVGYLIPEGNPSPSARAALHSRAPRG